MTDKKLLEQQPVEAEYVVEDTQTGSQSHYQHTQSTPFTKPAHTSNIGLYLLAFWVILLTFASAAVGFLLYNERVSQQLEVQQLHNNIAAHEKKVADAQLRHQESIDREFVAQQDVFAQQILGLHDENKKLNQRLTTLANTNTESWKLSEAQFLLRLANQRILLEHDSQNALALALSADNVLRDIQQVDTTSVRRVLAEEISILKMVGVVDREGIFLRLAALANQIDSIPFVEPLGLGLEAYEVDEPVANETWQEKIKRYFNAGVQKLSAYVRVRDHGKAVNAILPPQQQMYLLQNLRLMLEQAQVALLRNDAQIYRESLIKARNWINQYYTLNQEATSALAELESLLTEEVAPELTNFTNSSNALADFIEQRQKQAVGREDNSR